MALSRQERQALREIEDVLAAEDPALAALLRRGGVPWGEYVVRRTVRVVVGSALALLALGLVLSDAGMVSAAVLTLTALPVGLRLVIPLLGRKDPTDEG